jgi:hypothetical protein
VKWLKIEGRWNCHNADGSDHWDLCSKLRWQQTVDTGKRFEGKDNRKQKITGYKDSIHGTKLDSIESKLTVGKDRSKEISHIAGCNIPPWESCHCWDEKR